MFIENAGQWDSQAQFLSRTNGLNLWITREGPVFEFNRFIATGQAKSHTKFQRPEGYVMGHVVKMSFVNAAPTAVTGESGQKSRFNYFVGNDKTKWVSNAKSFSQVTAERPYDGISVRYSIDQGAPRYDVIVKPGADPSRVGIKIEGADDARVLENGNLELKTSLGIVEERGLTAYQDTPNGRTQVPCKMVMEGNTVHFDTGSYDPAKTLVIDPLVASTYLGGSGDQAADSVAVDSSNDIYVAGFTNSFNFPTTLGSYVSTWGSTAAYVSKLDPAETTLIYSSVIGGSKVNDADGVVVDGYGCAYITGTTTSTDFPVTTGAFQTQYVLGSSVSGFVSKLNPAGSALLYSTFLGGSVYDSPNGIGLDSAGEAVIAGATSSDDFPVTTGAFQTTNKLFTPSQQTYTGFVSKLNSTGTGLVYSTYLGGSGNSALVGDVPTGVAVDSSGDAVMCGASASPDFPTTSGAFQTINSEETDGFSTCSITKLNALGTQLVFSTLLGGSGNVTANYGEVANAVALDSNDNVTVVGLTGSTDFPTTSGALIPASPGPGGVVPFVSKLNATGTRLISSTYFEGPDNTVNGVTVDSVGDAILVGGVAGNFASTLGAFQSANPESSKVAGYVSEISSDGTSLLYSSYLGGENGTGDECYAVAINNAGNVVVVGDASSADFPTTAGAVESTLPSSEALFVTTLGISPFASFSITPSPVVIGAPCQGSITLANAAESSTTINLSSSSSFVTVPSSVVIGAGSASSTFDVTIGDATGESYITATLGTISQTVGVIAVSNALSGIQVAHTTVIGGVASTGTVQLAVTASAGDLYVLLTSNSAAATVPTHVLVPHGAMSVTFPITTFGVNNTTPVTITAIYDSQSVNTALDVIPAVVSSMSAAPSSVVGGSGATGTVQLAGTAGPAGDTVAITSSDPNVGVPASVNVPAGASSVQFPITSEAVSSQSGVTLTASFNSSSQTSQLVLTPATVTSVSVFDALVLGTKSATGTVQLSGPAGPSGDLVKLSSSTIRAIVPATVKVSAGQTSATFPISTTSVSSDSVATITATFGYSTQTTTLTVLPAPLSSLTASPTSVQGGNNASITVTLAGVAGPYGNVIKFATSSAELQLPATETIPAGESSHTFSVPTTPVSSTSVVTITDTFWVYSQTTTLTLTPATLQDLTFNPSSVVGGQPAAGTVVLNGVAGASGDVIKLSSNSSKVTVPPTITVLANQTNAQFTIQTHAVTADTQVTITATIGTSSFAQPILLKP